MMRFNRSILVLGITAFLAVGCGSNQTPAPAIPAPLGAPGPVGGGGAFNGGIEMPSPGGPIANYNDVFGSMTQNLRAMGAGQVVSDVNVMYQIQGYGVAPTGGGQPNQIDIPNFNYSASGNGPNLTINLTPLPRSNNNYGGGYVPQGNPYAPGNVGGMGGQFVYVDNVRISQSLAIASTDQVAVFACISCRANEFLRISYRTPNPGITYYIVDPIGPQFNVRMKNIATQLTPNQQFGGGYQQQPYYGY